MSLQVTPVSQCLEKKLTIAGYEIPDLLAIFFVLSVLNFAFSWTGQRLLLVWLPSVLLAAVLRFGKRGKPENYLLHWAKFQTFPKFYSAFPDPTNYAEPPSLSNIEIMQKR